MCFTACETTSQTKPTGWNEGSPYLFSVNWTVQVGAFKVERNSINMATKLSRAGVDAFHFVDNDGLFKVRFGSFETRAKAEASAESLRKRGLIEEYWVLIPSVQVTTSAEKAALRANIVSTAQRFKGVPYKWGGTSAATGFDCSGYTMTVYRLNGLQMPRTARDQYAKGATVSKSALQIGDLVFFDTAKKGYPTHVGIYIGNGEFIHAPRAGRNVEIVALNDAYYSKRYLGARAYF